MIRINLKGATKSWHGAFIKRSRPETPWSLQIRQERMAKPNAALTDWLGHRLCGGLYLKTAYQDRGRLVVTCGNLDLKDLHKLMNTVLVCEDGSELRLQGIGSTTYSESDYGRDGECVTDTYSSVEITFA